MSSPTPYEQTSYMPNPAELLQTLADDEDEARRRESEAIASRLRQKLVDERSPMRSMSPDYVASLPSSMIEKLRITPTEVEEILFHYAATSSIPATVRESGYGQAKVRAVVYSPNSAEPLAALRSAMRISVIRKIEETQLILLDALQNPEKLADATLTQISSILEDVSTVGENLRSASRESGGLASVDPATVFSGDELEYMAYLRQRLTSGGGPSPEAFYQPTPSSADSVETVEAEFVVSDFVSEIDISDDSVSPHEVVESI